jgi:hypothetical protein
LELLSPWLKVLKNDLNAFFKLPFPEAQSFFQAFFDIICVSFQAIQKLLFYEEEWVFEASNRALKKA